MKFWRFSFELQQFDAFWRKESFLCNYEWPTEQNTLDWCKKRVWILPEKRTHFHIFVPQSKTFALWNNLFFHTEPFCSWCIISPCAPTTKEKHETNRSPNSGLPTCGATRNANDKGLHMALLAFTLPQRKIFTQLLLGWLLKARTSGFVAFATFLKHRYLQCFMLPRPFLTAAHSISWT